MKGSALLFLALLLGISSGAFSQPSTRSETATPDPKAAFLRSLAIPGWGHHYVNPDDWTRGQYHLGAEVALILSLAGFQLHSNQLEQNWYTYARVEAGIDIEGRPRSFRLAIGDFNNLQAYNEFQERSRNWDRLIAETPENRWSWQSIEKRDQFTDLRERVERIDRQLPALLSLMVVNRIVSALSAYNRASKISGDQSATAFHLSTNGANGLVANVRIAF